MEQKQRNKARAYSLKYNYGITVKEYDQLLKQQGGVCAICGKPPQTKRLSVDHKHVPKERILKKKGLQSQLRANVRGLLDWKCNTALQKFRDNAKLMRAAADYLDNPPAKKVLDNNNNKVV